MDVEKCLEAEIRGRPVGGPVVMVVVFDVFVEVPRKRD